MSRSNWKIRASKAKRVNARNAKAERKPFTADAGIACHTIRAAEGEGEGKKLGTFTGNAYTGAAMKPSGWYGNLIVDLDGVRIPDQQRPVLRQHDHEQIVGHTESVKVQKDGPDKGILIDGVLSGQPEHTEKVTTLAKNGFKWQLSIGAEPIATEFLEAGEELEVNGELHKGPATISRVTELGEISFVPLGADGNTSATVAASRGIRAMFHRNMLKAAKANGNVRAAKFSDDEIEKMSEDEAKATLKKCMKADDKNNDSVDDGSKLDAEDSDVDAEDSDVDADDDSDVDADGTDTDTDDKPKAKAKAGRGGKTIRASKGGRSIRSSKRNRSMSSKSIRAAVNTGVEQGLKAARSAAAAETRRVNEIHARAMKYATAGQRLTYQHNGQPVDLLAHSLEAGWTPDTFELHALRQHRPAAAGPHIHIPGAPVLNEAVFECAVFDALPDFKLFDKDFYEHGENGQRRVPEREQRRITAELNARYTDQVRQAAHTHFKGRLGFQQLLTMLAAQNGYRGPATFNDPSGWGEVAAYLSGSIRADGPSSVNTPATLANVQNKFLLQGYMFTEQSYLEICATLPVKDLKPTKSVQLFGDFQFQPLSPSGEIQHASVGDNPYANQANLQARMVTLDLQYIINDDMSAFGQLPMMLGRGWGLRVNDLVWAKYLNPGFDDGGSTNFFAATHTLSGTQKGNSNLASGATSTLTSDGVKAAKLLFDRQVDPAGKPLGVAPEILLYPPELDTPAIELMNAQFLVMAGLASTSAASKQPNTNIWRGRFKPVMSRYLSNSAYTGYSLTQWYLLANPAVIPVIQIAALNGQMTPQIQTAGQDWQFNMLGISMRGWGGVGVAMQNFRGAVASAGV